MGTNVSPSPTLPPLPLAPPTGSGSNPGTSQGGVRGEDYYKNPLSPDFECNSKAVHYRSLGARPKTAYETKKKQETSLFPV